MGGFGDTKRNGEVNNYTILLKFKETIKPYSENRMQTAKSIHQWKAHTNLSENESIEVCRIRHNKFGSML